MVVKAFLDYFDFHFLRSLIADNGSMRFRSLLLSNRPQQYVITGMPSGTNTVWNVTNPGNCGGNYSAAKWFIRGVSG